MPSNADSACKWCGGSGFVRTAPNDRFPQGAEAPCRCVRQNLRRRHAAALMERSGLDAQTMARWSFDTFHPERAVANGEGIGELQRIVADCRAYAEGPRGWMILTGPYGCGKSHLAYATAAAVYRAGQAVVVSTVPDLLEALRQGFDEGGSGFAQRFAAVRDADLTVLDDLGAQYDTPWAAEKLYQIVDYRLRRRLPMIVTTNAILTDPRCRIEPRVRSRLLDGAQVEGGFSRLCLIPAGDYRLRAGGPR